MSCEEFAHARPSEGEVVRKLMELGDIGEPGLSPDGFDNSQAIFRIALELRNLVLLSEGRKPHVGRLEVGVGEQ